MLLFKQNCLEGYDYLNVICILYALCDICHCDQIFSLVHFYILCTTNNNNNFPLFTEMMAKDIPDLIQRRDLKTINLSMESNASQISNCHLQHSPRSLDKLRGGQPPSYESFLRKKSQKGEKPTKHIHFADETPGGDLNCEGGVTKNICDVESGRNNMVDYYHARDRGRVQRCESYKTRNNCKDLTDQSPGDTYHARQTSEPSKVYDLSNTVTSVMV